MSGAGGTGPLTFEGPTLGQTSGIGALTLGGFLGEVVDRHGPREAVVFDDPLIGGETVRWTYDDLGRAADRLAGALMAAGVAVGDAVVVLMGNRPEAIAAIFAAGLIGAVAMPVSTFAPAPELTGILRATGASVVLTQKLLGDRQLGEDVASIGSVLGELGQVAVLGEQSWDALLALGDDVPDADRAQRAAAVGADDPALVIFSSGTTAAPKGVLHGHRAPTLQFWVQAGIFGRHDQTRMFSALPIFWTAGLNSAVGSTLAAGGCWIAQEVFEPGAALALLARERVTEPYTLPHQTAALAEHPRWLSTDLSAIGCAYGKGAYARHPTVDPNPRWIMPVGYGLSETCAFVAGYRSDESREQMAVGNGRLLPGARLRVVDPATGDALGVGEEGELAVAGATLMLGYLGREWSSTFDADGFFHTGDVGFVDADGIVHYTGRRTEMIKTAGANVSPAEIEVALRAFPPVKLSRIVGVDDERLDQLVVACVVCREGTSATEEEVQGFLRERLSPYKVPKRVLFLDDDEMPLTAGGTKVRDDALMTIVHHRLGHAGPSKTTEEPNE